MGNFLNAPSLIFKKNYKSMKTKILSIFAAVAMMFVASSCEQQVETEITNSYDKGELDLSFEQTGNQGNGITLKMNTKGVYGYWDYNTGKKYSDEVSFVYPVPGKATFTYHILNSYTEDGGHTIERGFTQTIEVQVDEFDQPLPEQYAMLTGEDLKGKTWVLDGEPGGDKTLWWFMSPNDNIGGCMGAWWNAGEEGDAPAVGEEINFSLDGAATVTRTTPDGTVTTGPFAYNAAAGELSIPGPAYIMGEFPNNNTAPVTGFQVAEISADRLVLYVSNLKDYGRADACGWTWVFVPKN